jgi:uncharacterized protein DUF6200
MRRAKHTRSEFSPKHNPPDIPEDTMAQAPTTVESREQREQREKREGEEREPHRLEKALRPQAVLVDLGRRQSPKQIKRLRKGRGKLMRRIDEIIDDLAAAGTVKATAQPVIIVVRERPPVAWPFSVEDFDDDDDD